MALVRRPAVQNPRKVWQREQRSFGLDAISARANDGTIGLLVLLTFFAQGVARSPAAHQTVRVVGDPEPLCRRRKSEIVTHDFSASRGKPRGEFQILAPFLSARRILLGFHNLAANLAIGIFGSVDI